MCCALRIMCCVLSNMRCFTSLGFCCYAVVWPVLETLSYLHDGCYIFVKCVASRFASVCRSIDSGNQAVSFVLSDTPLQAFLP